MQWLLDYADERESLFYLENTQEEPEHEEQLRLLRIENLEAKVDDLHRHTKRRVLKDLIDAELVTKPDDRHYISKKIQSELVGKTLRKASNRKLVTLLELRYSYGTEIKIRPQSSVSNF